MANIKDILYNKYRKYATFVMIFIIVVFFLWLSYYCYTTIFLPKIKNRNYKDVVNSPEHTEVIIHFFFTDWCPYCTKAKPDWEKFTSEYNNKIINNHVVKCIPVNCTAGDDDQEISEKMQQYNIEHFPTIKMTKGADIIDFDARVNYDNLSKFVNTVVA